MATKVELSSPSIDVEGTETVNDNSLNIDGCKLSGTFQYDSKREWEYVGKLCGKAFGMRSTDTERIQD